MPDVDIPDFVRNITVPELEQDPYPFYARLRAEAPVTWVPALDSWVAASWIDCEQVGGAPESQWQKADPRGADSTLARVTERVIGLNNVLNVDGPKHTDLRAGIDPSLEARAVLDYVDDLVQPIAQRYAEQLLGRDQVELCDDYFNPVSVEALRHVLGLDGVVDTETLVRWFKALSDASMNITEDEGIYAAAEQANAEIRVVLTPVLEALTRIPDDGMLSHMIHAGRQGAEPRTVEEILPSVRIMLTGGMQEPGHAAAITMLGLLQNPEQLEEVIEDEDLIPTAVHEGLRWISPASFTERYAVGDQVVGGVTIPAGDMIMLILASANRDETRFDRPDDFDLNRSRQANQAFGYGAHLCAGNFFGRHVERIMFEELLPRVPSVRLDPDAAPVVTGLGFRAPKIIPALIGDVA